jgi:hypothetical protein
MYAALRNATKQQHQQATTLFFFPSIRIASHRIAPAPHNRIPRTGSLCSSPKLLRGVMVMVMVMVMLFVLSLP